MYQVTPVTPAIDFKVNITTGEAYISIRKTAELLGIDEKTIRNFLDLSAPNYDRKQGLTPEILQKVTQHYSLKGNLAAIDLLGKLATAGAKAFIYHEAGVKLQPVISPELPQNHIEAVRAYLVTLETVEAQKVQLAAQMTTIEQQDNLIKEDAILTAKSDTYIPIKQVKELNPTMRISGKLLSRISNAQGYEVRQLFSQYSAVSTNAYHKSLWELCYPNAKLE